MRIRYKQANAPIVNPPEQLDLNKKQELIASSGRERFFRTPPTVKPIQPPVEFAIYSVGTISFAVLSAFIGASMCSYDVNKAAQQNAAGAFLISLKLADIYVKADFTEPNNAICNEILMRIFAMGFLSTFFSGSIGAVFLQNEPGLMENVGAPMLGAIIVMLAVFGPIEAIRASITRPEMLPQSI